jgi:pentapeptide MXKDX repeat protein
MTNRCATPGCAIAQCCYAMLCCAMRCDAMRCDAMRCDAMRCDAMRCDAMLCDAMLGAPSARTTAADAERPTTSCERGRRRRRHRRRVQQPNAGRSRGLDLAVARRRAACGTFSLARGYRRQMQRRSRMRQSVQRRRLPRRRPRRLRGRERSRARLAAGVAWAADPTLGMAQELPRDGSSLWITASARGTAGPAGSR